MSKWLLDTSAALAWLWQEPGQLQVEQALFEGAALTVVNFAEIGTKLVQRGYADHEIVRALGSFDVEIVPLDEVSAIISGLLIRHSRSRGLSLGDRVCLAVATDLDVPILTGDREWAEIDLPWDIDIHLIR